MWSQRRAAGSFTVEAALVVPLVIFVIATILSFGFYLHDLCAVRAVAETLVEQLCHVKDTESQIYEQIGKDADFHSTLLGFQLGEQERKELEQLLIRAAEQRLILGHVKMCKLICRGATVRADIQVSAELSVPMIRSILPELTDRVVEEGTIYDPVRTVRYGRMIYDELERTRLYESIQSLLERMENYLS